MKKGRARGRRREGRRREGDDEDETGRGGREDGKGGWSSPGLVDL